MTSTETRPDLSVVRGKLEAARELVKRNRNQNHGSYGDLTRAENGLSDALSLLSDYMGGSSGTKCKAGQSYGGSDPQDCDWPWCGCDPAAAKVLEAIEEQGLEVVDKTRGSSWRGIESAPRDGSRFLGLTKFGVEVVKWSEHEGREFEPLSGWIGVEQDSTCFPGNSLRPEATYQPTHWQPLPEPPQEGSERSQPDPQRVKDAAEGERIAKRGIF